MTETVMIGLIGAGAGLIGAAIGGAVAVITTRVQVAGAERQRKEGRRLDVLLDAISELLPITDTQTLKGFDFSQTIVLIHRVQLVLDPRQGDEQTFNGSLERLKPLRQSVTRLGQYTKRMGRRTTLERSTTD